LRSPLEQAKRKLVLSLVLFTGLLIFGTCGFYVADHLDATPGGRTLVEAFYFTLVVLTTVGMEGPVSDMERYFAIFLMLVGIFLVAAAASNLVAFAIDGELNKHFGRRKLEKQIEKLEGHFIVVGFGRMGRALCERMATEDEAFVLVELDEDLAEEAEALGYLCIHGDATDEHVLDRAGITQAGGLATCLPNDPANVFVTLTARGLRPQIEIVARAEDPATEAKLLKAGASRVICPPVEGASRLHEMLIKPVVTDLIPQASAEADAVDACVFRVDGLPKLLGRSLAEADIPGQTGMLVAAVERDGQRTFSPPTSFTLADTDKLYLMGPEGGIDKLIEAYGQGRRPKRGMQARY
jgi:voltage-gated potassium channel